MKPGRFLLLVLLIAAGGRGSAQAQSSPPLFVGAGTAATDWRPVLRMNGVLEDPAFRNALDSGLPLRFHLRIELWEKGVLDRLVGSRQSEQALVRDPFDGSYALLSGNSNRPLTSLAEAERILVRNSVQGLQPSGRGRYYYLAALEVETLSLSDLEELQRWLRGDARSAAQGRTPVGRAVGRGVQRAFVRMMGLPTRRYEARSPTFTIE
jgi:hypothetical protein